jgi:transposase
MSMGRRRRLRPQAMWISSAAVARSASHPFYARLNQILEEAGFDTFVEGLCGKFYAEQMGRPGLAPGVYFRSLLIGYFEGIDSERGIAWRAGDSLSIRQFLDIDIDEATPDHSTISRTRRLIDVETHQQVFAWVLRVLAERDLLKGKTLGIDATTLEANAALRSIVRRDNGQTYQEFLTKLAKDSGIETPTREQLAKLDRKRPKKGSNAEWRHPHDPDARITKMKDGRTHLAHKAEHAVDLDTGAVVSVTITHADEGDAASMVETLAQAGERIAELAAEVNNEQAGEIVDSDGPANVVADKGYHSNDSLVGLQQAQVRSYISEPDRGRRNWVGKTAARDAVYSNRRRIHGDHGKALLRRRGELLERSFAHAYDTGGMRRTHLRGSTNICKRVLIHVAALNLGLVMRQLTGFGTPRGLQSAPESISGLLNQLAFWVSVLLQAHRVTSAHPVTPIRYSRSIPLRRRSCTNKSPSTTGC